MHRTRQVYFFFPMFHNDFLTREAKIILMVRCFARALRYSAAYINTYKIHLHINGTALNEKEFSEYYQYLKLLFRQDIHLTSSPEAGKLQGINAAIVEARKDGFNLFFCLDNDIVFSEHLIKEIIYKSLADTNSAAITLYKAPYVHATSNEFQRLYSFGIYHSLANNLYQKRPTGSFYCLNLFVFDSFPEGCNEGDYLDRIAIQRCIIPVYSEYPLTFELEIERRRKHLSASKSINYERLHLNKGYLLEQMKKPFLPNVIKTERYFDALALQFNLIEVINNYGF